MGTDLEEALTAANVTALIQKQISPVLLEYVRRYSPFVRSVPTIKWGSNVYNFNQRTALAPGGFVQDGGARPVGTSTYVQLPFTMRNLQAVGAVTGYASAVTVDLMGGLGALRAREIEGAVKGLTWDIETAMCWGSAGATQFGPYPMFDGLDQLVNTTSGNAQNTIAGGGNALSLGYLDMLIDLVEANISEPVADASWMFVMSTTANSKIAQLLTNLQRFVRDVPGGAGGMGSAEVAAGLIVPTYRDIPIVRSSFLNPRATAMSAVVATPTNSGGSLAAAEYFYKVECVFSRFGVTQSCAEVNATVSGGASIVTLSFTPPSGPDSAVPLLYRVFRSTTTNTETLLGVVDANVGLMADGITPIVATSIVDTGATLIPQNGVTQPAQSPATYQGTDAGIVPRAAGGDTVWLVSRDPNYLIRPYVRDITPVEVYPTTASPDSLPFALVSDTCLAVRAQKYIARLDNIVSTLSS